MKMIQIIFVCLITASCQEKKPFLQEQNKEKIYYKNALDAVEFTAQSLENLLTEKDSVKRFYDAQSIINGIFPNNKCNDSLSIYRNGSELMYVYRMMLVYQDNVSEPSSLIYNGLYKFFIKHKKDIFSLKFYANYKNILWACLDKETAKRIGFLSTIHLLRSSYHFIKTQDYITEFNKITQNNIDTKVYFFRNRFSHSLKNPKYPYAEFHSWLYSFWYRRHLEGNMETVYGVLKEIEEHYNNQK